MKQVNTKGNNQGQGISLNVAYKNLKALYAERCSLEEAQSHNWDLAHHSCANRSELAVLSRKISKTTHSINVILSKLCQCEKSHEVMNFAYKYITAEIARLNKIVNKWDSDHSVSSSGTYLNQKSNQIEQLRKWQSHFRQYCV